MLYNMLPRAEVKGCRVSMGIKDEGRNVFADNSNIGKDSIGSDPIRLRAIVCLWACGWDRGELMRLFNYTERTLQRDLRALRRHGWREG